MKLLSIDIGIKNLALCIIYIKDDGTFDIIQWDVINLCNQVPLCKCITLNKKKQKTCDKKATYEKDGIYYCKIHAKKTDYIIPSAETKINKLKLNELIHLANKFSVEPSIPIKKKDVFEKLKKHIDNNTFSIVTKSKANELSLIDIGIAITHKLTDVLDFNNIDRVIIENQLSPLASRMKTIQGMVAQYFIMNNKTDIFFISAINKLKPFTIEKLNYKERKECGIKITHSILKNINNSWSEVFEKHSKKDDLADSLLQGLSYAYKNKLIKTEIMQNINVNDL